MKRLSKKEKKPLADVLPLSSVLEVVVRQELRNFVIDQGMAADEDPGGRVDSPVRRSI